ncbi:MAG: AEC family transporter [Aestuariivita sp.]|uniref:AEC family transporter n=1 Tax=Aestuariivita sp. TaxID=1872407 RepID=UPI003BAE6989
MLQTLIDVILPVFLVIGSGYAATRAGYLSFANIDGIMKFTQGFAIPCLLFSAIANLDLQTSFDPRLLVSYYTGSAICFGLGILGARVLFKRDWEDSVAIGFCGLFSNSVLLGLPITERAYGPDSLVGNFAIIAMHSAFCYALGITTMEAVRNRGKSGRSLLLAVFKGMFSNTLVLGIMLGFLFNLNDWTLPGAIDDALSLIIAAALPGALFALGGVLVQYRPEGDLRAIAMVCVIALLIHPAITWSLGKTLSLPDDLFRSGVLTAAMAPGFNAYIFANTYGRARRVAASSVLIATGVSILTVWGWLTVLG